MKCIMCGKEFEYGQRPDGLPNGVGFVTDEGLHVAWCTDCLIEMGSEDVLTNEHLTFSEDNVAEV